MTTINWKIGEMACYPKSGENEKVVHFAKWNCTATDGMKTESVSADHILPSPTGNFTPYDQLTQDQVLSWLWASGVDKDAVEANLIQTLTIASDPVSVSLPLPWSNA
jgi:hypothetical protein